MALISLNFLVLRSSNLDNSCDFFRALGFELTREQHGESAPIHYSGKLGDTIIEIYPPKASLSPYERIDSGVMVGINVENLEETIDALKTAGFQVNGEPKVSEWGKRIIIKEPSGMSVHLIESS